MMVQAGKVRRIQVDDAAEVERRAAVDALKRKLYGKSAETLTQAELAELVLLLAHQAGLVDAKGKVKG